MSTNVKQITMKAHSAAEVSKHIAGKDDLYYATVRNGYYLPSLKSSIITEDYLADVACGRVLCPRYDEVRLKPCPFPPDKETLLRLAQKIAEHRGKPTGIDDKHTPNRAWLVALVSTYLPGHDIFKKSYVPPPRVVKVADNVQVDYPDDFFEDLPPSRKKGKHRRVGLIAKGKEEAKAERYKRMQDKFKKAYLKAKNDVDAKKHAEKNRIVALSARPSRAQSPRNQHSWNQGASQQAATGSFSTQMMSGGNAPSQQMSQSTTVQNPQSRSPDKSNTAGVGSKRGGGGGNFTGLIHGSNA